jgi:hypothetical protein
MTEYSDGKSVFTAGALLRFTPAEAATLSPELQRARLDLLQYHSVPGVPVLNPPATLRRPAFTPPTPPNPYPGL